MTTIEDIARAFGEVKTAPLSKFQKIVSRRLTQSWTEIPHVTHFDEVDVTKLEAYRKALAPEQKVSPVPFLARALAKTLGEFPNFNASLSEDGGTLISKRYFHIGIAVDGPLGLLVPVLRDVDTKDVLTVATELAEFSSRARAKGLAMDDMLGSCMTITSLGGIGGTGFTPIINQPDVAILGVNPAKMQPVWNGSAFEPRLLMPLSLSYDHRVINGVEAARFVRRLGDFLLDPAAL